jgi:hypothetical protein
MDGLIRQTGGLVKPFENESVEQFVKRLGGYLLRTHLQKMHLSEIGLKETA